MAAGAGPAQHLGTGCSRGVLEVRRAAAPDRRGPHSFPLKGSNWFARPIETTERAWRSDIALLDDMHRSLRAAIANLPPATLHHKNGTGQDTNFSLITGVAAHDLYHAGQIQLLKRLRAEGKGLRAKG